MAQYHGTFWRRFTALTIVVCLSLFGQRAAGDEPQQAALLKAQLDAGEFGPALATAQSAATASHRNAMLSQIAKAQLVAGDRSSVYQTVAQMDDDRVVTETLSAVKTQPSVSNGHFGGNQADFDPLIDLITSTISPSTWSDMGGPGTVQPFPGGVLIDADGVLRRQLNTDRTGSLIQVRQAALEQTSGNDVRRSSGMRKISLVQLERQIQILAAQGRQPTDEMQALGGLQRIKYVLVYPEQGDIVLSGPAGPWRTDFEGRLVSTETGRPVLRLDDLVVVLRYMMSSNDVPFGCNITPTQASLAKVKEFVGESNKAPLKPGQRETWLGQLRDKLGRQNIEVYGIEPRTRVGLVLVEADYRMKLIGMGLEESVPGVPSYLDSIELAPGQAPPPMDVLRWWFTLNYDAVAASPHHDAFELRGQGVQVQSENEMLTAAGQQVHTGNSDILNQQFAHNFTKHFSDLATKYPIYAELQNICDLALVAALMKRENLPETVGWHMLHFGDPKQYVVPLGVAPQSVETVINHRVVNKTTIIVGVSGGVRVDAGSQLKAGKYQTDDYALPALRQSAVPKKENGRQRWWWD
jgi:hypothetical protein